MFCPNCGKPLTQDSKFCPFCGTNLLNPSAHVSAAPSYYGVASAGTRFANYLVDYFAAIIFIVIIGSVGSVVFQNSAGQGFMGVLYFLYLPLYYLFFEGIWQRTPGKWITKTKVVMQDGSKPDFKHILGRSFARIIPFEPFSFLAGPVGWHDSLSKTLVVPANYTADEIKQIDSKQTAKSGVSTPIIIVICVFIMIAVIGLFSSVVLLALNSARAKARDAKRIADVRELASSLELYYNDYSHYPESLDKLPPKYIGILPTAPTPPDGNCTADDNEYKYIFINTDYKLSFCLGENTGGYSAGIHYFTSKGIGDNSNSTVQ